MQPDPQVLRTIFWHITAEYLVIPAWIALVIIGLTIWFIKDDLKDRPRDKQERIRLKKNRDIRLQELRDELQQEQEQLQQETNPVALEKLKSKHRRHKRRYRQARKRVNWVLVVLIALELTGCAAVPIGAYSSFNYDIKNENYVVYEGPIEFGTASRQTPGLRSVATHYRVCRIKRADGGTETITIVGFENIPNYRSDTQQYVGRLVYTKTLTYVVALELEPLP